MNQHEKHHPSSGVEALIEQLRDQGVQRGREEAELLLKDARQKATQMLDEARHEAELIRMTAKKRGGSNSKSR